MKKIKFKNYIIAISIILTTFIISFYILTWYKQYNMNVLKEPIINDVLSSIKYNELDNIIRDRDFLIIYTCTSSENKCRNFEKKLKNYVKERDLSDDIVYLNLGCSNDNNNYINNIYNRYKSDNLLKQIKDYPAFIVFNEGHIIDVLSSNDEKIISISDLENLLEGYDVK